MRPGKLGSVNENAEQRRSLPLRMIHRLYVLVRGYFAIVGLLVTLGPVLIVALATRGGGEAPKAKVDFSAEHPARLKLGLHGLLVEKEPDISDRFLSRLFGDDTSLYLPDIRSALRRAATDERVARLEIEIGSLTGSLAELTELRRMLVEFRDGGKPLHAVLVEGSDWNYYVASAAGQVILNPASSLVIPGPTFTLTYFGEALRKLGVEIEVLRAGKYKSAFEAFVQNAPSEPTLEQYRTMEESLRAHLVEAVAASRGKDAATVRGWFQRSIFTAEEARASGLVDAIGYDAEASDLPATAAREPLVKLEDYAASGAPETRPVVEDQGGIALIEAVGEIHMGDSGMADEGITPLGMRRELRWAQTDDKVKAVVLRVSSPGGSAVASDMIWNDVRKLAAEKPVVVSMGAYAASGGYYISAPAHRLIAEPTTITGSIGVIGMLPRLGAFEEKYGVSFHIITQSDRARLLNPGTKGTDEDKALMTATIDQVYKTFVEKVAAGRKMPAAEVDARAQGRVYSGLQALDLKLVDAIGGLPDAFKAAKELAGFDVDKLYPVLHYEGDELDLHECLGSPQQMMRCLRRGGARVALPPLPVDLVWAEVAPRRIEAVAQTLERWVGAGALAIWPGYLSAALDRPAGVAAR